MAMQMPCSGELKVTMVVIMLREMEMTMEVIMVVREVEVKMGAITVVREAKVTWVRNQSQLSHYSQPILEKRISSH